MSKYTTDEVHESRANWQALEEYARREVQKLYWTRYPRFSLIDSRPISRYS